MNTALFKLIRPKQWIKNTFVFLPIFFGGSLLDGGDVLAGILTFFAFCFAASSIYCFNDLVDVEADILSNANDRWQRETFLSHRLMD